MGNRLLLFISCRDVPGTSLLSFFTAVYDFLSPTRQTHALTLLIRNLIIKPVFHNPKTRFAQHLGIVAAELAHMVVLSKEALAFLRVGDAWVFEGIHIGIDGHEENGPAIRFQNALDFGWSMAVTSR